MTVNQAVYPVQLMAKVLGVSRSGFYAWQRRAPSTRSVADAALSVRIAEIHTVSKQTFVPATSFTIAIRGHNTRHWPSACDAKRLAFVHQWARWATHTTTPLSADLAWPNRLPGNVCPRASLPRSSASCSIGESSAPRRRLAWPSSSSSRAGTTRRVATRRSATNPQSRSKGAHKKIYDPLPANRSRNRGNSRQRLPISPPNRLKSVQPLSNMTAAFRALRQKRLPVCTTAGRGLRDEVEQARVLPREWNIGIFAPCPAQKLPTPNTSGLGFGCCSWKD